VVAAINGAAVGIGATVILPMDARVALAGAKFAMPFTKRGIAWDGCASWFLPRLVGIETALDWGLSGRTFLAEEALEKKLVSELADTPEAVLEEAMARARRLTANTAPVSVAMNRRLVWRMLGAPHPMDAHRLESRAILHRGMSPDAMEGVTSFLEKRRRTFPVRCPPTIRRAGRGMPIRSTDYRLSTLDAGRAGLACAPHAAGAPAVLLSSPDPQPPL
jgi:enoyl-CoA hydratase/carnithine racemase